MRGDRIITLIGAFKLAKALALIAVGIGALSAIHGDIWRWVSAVRVDPNNRYIERALALAQDPKKLHELGIGTFIYAALFAVEGMGLLAHKRWAEYLTIAITGSFIPLELYELVEHRSVAKLVILIVNLAIVVYLVARVITRSRRDSSRLRRNPTRDSPRYWSPRTTARDRGRAARRGPPRCLPSRVAENQISTKATSANQGFDPGA